MLLPRRQRALLSGPPSAALALIGLAAVGFTPCAGGAAPVSSTVVAGWQDVAPLPEARWFHTASLGGDGRIYAYGGYVRDPEAGGWRTFGQGGHAMVAYDPGGARWERVPEPMRPAGRSLVLVGLQPAYRERPSRAYGRKLTFDVPIGAAQADGRVYWLGRHGQALAFEPGLGVWLRPPQTGAPPPYAERLPDRAPAAWRSGGAVASGPDGRLWVAGGLVRRRSGWPARDSGARYRLSATLEVYDPRTDRWETRAPMGRARQHFAATFGPDGKLYVFGGFGGVGWMELSENELEREGQLAENRRLVREPLASVEVYDPTTDRWEPRCPMPRGRENMGAALGADGRIYVVGGASSYADPAPERSVLVYEPERDAWTEGPPLRQARYGHAVVAGADGRIYALGGLAPSDAADAALRRLTDEPPAELQLASVEALATGPAGKPRRLDASGFRSDPRYDLPALLAAVEGKNAEERRAFAPRLAELVGPADAELVPRLAAVVADDDAVVRSAVARALRRIGEPARAAQDPLLQLLHDEDRSVRWEAVDTLIALGSRSDTLWAALIAQLGSDDLDDRVRAAAALARCGAAVIEAVAADAARAEHPHPEAPLRVLARLGAASALARALGDPRTPVREAAAYELGELGAAAEPEIPALAQRAWDEEPTVRLRAAMALGRIGPKALPTLLAALERAAPGERPDLVWALGEAGADSQSAAAGLDAYLRATLALSSPARRSAGQRAACDALHRLGRTPEGCSKSSDHP